MHPSLLDPVTLEPSFRFTDPDTSVHAATVAAVNAGTNRALALRVHAAHPDGLTDFELAEITGVQQTSCGKRRGELVRMGMVARTDQRRPSPSGTPAVVWQITPGGAIAAEALLR
jgi:hypothetical protein